MLRPHLDLNDFDKGPLWAQLSVGKNPALCFNCIVNSGDKLKQIEVGIESVRWIQSAGKRSRELMFADSVLKDYEHVNVGIYYVGALLNALEDYDGTVVINDLATIICDLEKPGPDEERLHPLQSMSLGEAIAILALGGDESPGGAFSSNSNPAIRLASAAIASNPEILDYLSLDPCMLVRTAVAVNDHTSKETKDRLRRDPFFHVQRRTLYGDSIALLEFDEKARLNELDEVDGDSPVLWPKDCACVEADFVYEDFNHFFQVNELFVPDIPIGLSNKIREFDSWYWGTQPYPEPFDDYLMQSAEYLKKAIPDQYAITLSGHGINSYGLNFRLAIGNLAILAQVGWYGAYNDPQSCKDAWNAMAHEIDEILQARTLNYSPEIRKRDFLIVYSDFRLDCSTLWKRQNDTWVIITDDKPLSEISNFF